MVLERVLRVTLGWLFTPINREVAQVEAMIAGTWSYVRAQISVSSFFYRVTAFFWSRTGWSYQ